LAGRRWSNAGELQICLRSIQLHAPWIRRTWIITDGQVPSLKSGPHARVKIIDHSEIFRGHEDVLPTFNSLAIGTACWRIDGLSDQFIYFNDDTFLLNPVAPSDFFIGDRIVLRGKWMSLPDAARDEYLERKSRYNKVEGANRLGFGEARFFSSAHVAHPMHRPTLESIFREHPDWFAGNIRPRFRETAQFSISSLFAHKMIKDDRVQFAIERDWRNFSSEWCATVAPSAAKRDLAATAREGRKLICVNDLRRLEERVPGFTRRLKLWIMLTSLRHRAIRRLSFILRRSSEGFPWTSYSKRLP
jgi:hypothetical protein